MSTDTGFGQVRLFDDFIGDTLEVGPWTAASTNAATAYAINVQDGGVVRGTVTNNSSNDLSVLYSELVYKANDGGPLIFEARCKPVTSLSLLLFAGLSDQKASELPLDYNGGTFSSTATDAAGFYYAGGEASATWRCGGVAAGVDSTQTAVNARYNPVLTTYQTLRVVLNPDGSGSFYINGNIIKENVSGCAAATVALTPFFAVTDDGAAGSWDVDYCYVNCGRSTT